MKTRIATVAAIVGVLAWWIPSKCSASTECRDHDAMIVKMLRLMLMLEDPVHGPEMASIERSVGPERSPSYCACLRKLAMETEDGGADGQPLVLPDLYECRSPDDQKFVYQLMLAPPNVQTQREALRVMGRWVLNREEVPGAEVGFAARFLRDIKGPLGDTVARDHESAAIALDLLKVFGQDPSKPGTVTPAVSSIAKRICRTLDPTNQSFECNAKRWP